MVNLKPITKEKVFVSEEANLFRKLLLLGTLKLHFKFILHLNFSSLSIFIQLKYRVEVNIIFFINCIEFSR